MRWLWGDLSKRERKIILSYIKEGKGMREIASDVGVSFNRVKQILHAVYRVMDVRDHIELAFEIGRHWKEIEKGE